MKGLAESSPFHLLTYPHVINRFIFGHGVVIYYQPHFYIVILGYKGVYPLFLFLLQKIDCGCMLESPRPQSMF